jgi:hypothetical protein
MTTPSTESQTSKEYRYPKNKLIQNYFRQQNLRIFSSRRIHAITKFKQNPLKLVNKCPQMLKFHEEILKEFEPVGKKAKIILFAPSQEETID